MTDDVEAALKRLRADTALLASYEDELLTAAQRRLKHNWPIIEAHIASQQVEIERLRGLLRDCRVASRIQDWETRCKEIDDMVRHALAGEEAKP